MVIQPHGKRSQARSRPLLAPLDFDTGVSSLADDPAEISRLLQRFGKISKCIRDSRFSNASREKTKLKQNKIRRPGSVLDKKKKLRPLKISGSLIHLASVMFIDFHVTTRECILTIHAPLTLSIDRDLGFQRWSAGRWIFVTSARLVKSAMFRASPQSPAHDGKTFE